MSSATTEQNMNHVSQHVHATGHRASQASLNGVISMQSSAEEKKMADAEGHTLLFYQPATNKNGPYYELYGISWNWRYWRRNSCLGLHNHILVTILYCGLLLVMFGFDYSVFHTPFSDISKN